MYFAIFREGTKEMDMVQVSSEKEFDALPRTKWNIQQPSMDAVCAEAIDAGGLDLVICPGVAFTIEGHRCGYGMGYYDRYLTKLRNSCPNKKAVLVGLAFKVQIVDNAELPWEDTDIKMDRILHS
ncbi:5-formyltetrahydrofolate cyclo-ligase-like isoform X1 [Varroa jacobsoni]|uniref:5-formyltetrahydrofolate cyclo-ligase-like isoform X1 n=1 Tax=Varroa jacobsoni TaxID=62625 RepID=UPI000BF356F9|nr:5-formyltetrahydrofolate cyclo-ligase-like isoform X1 [Varroa jacobsoni]